MNTVEEDQTNGGYRVKPDVDPQLLEIDEKMQKIKKKLEKTQKKVCFCKFDIPFRIFSKK